MNRKIKNDEIIMFYKNWHNLLNNFGNDFYSSSKSG